MGRDSLAKIKTVLQSCIRGKEKESYGKKKSQHAGKCNKPAASASLDLIPVLELIKSKSEIKGFSGVLSSSFPLSVVVPGVLPGSCRTTGAEVLPSPLLPAQLRMGRGFERPRSLFFFSFSQYNPYRAVIIWLCFSSECSLISCLWF